VKKEFKTTTFNKSDDKLKIHIFKELCKSCEICIAFCPKDVLALGDDRKVAVANIEACNGDRLCELRCPDLAIFVEKQ
jgi:2-oxoglutarate ferredoxin oxidoreductase subunit delta